MVARLWYGQCVGLCVFDLDHTLIRTPLDLAAMAADMRRLIERERGPLPDRPERYRVFELVAWSKSQAPDLERAVWAIALEHEWRAMGAAAAVGVPFVAYGAREADLTRHGVTPVAWLSDLARLPEWLTAHFGFQGSPRRSNRLGSPCHDGHGRT